MTRHKAVALHRGGMPGQGAPPRAVQAVAHPAPAPGGTGTRVVTAPRCVAVPSSGVQPVFGKAFPGAVASGVPTVTGGTAMAAGGGVSGAGAGALGGLSKAAILGGGALAVAGGITAGSAVAYLDQADAFNTLFRLAPPALVAAPPAAALPRAGTGPEAVGMPGQEARSVPVPEPASLLVFLAGGAGAVLARRRQAT